MPDVADVVSFSLYSKNKTFFDFDLARIAWPKVLKIMIQKLFNSRYVLFVRDEVFSRDKVVENDLRFLVTNKVMLAEPDATSIGSEIRWVGTTDDDKYIQFHNFATNDLRSVFEDYYAGIRA